MYRADCRYADRVVDNARMFDLGGMVMEVIEEVGQSVVSTWWFLYCFRVVRKCLRGAWL